jgi:hypothetical protein
MLRDRMRTLGAQVAVTMAQVASERKEPDSLNSVWNDVDTRTRYLRIDRSNLIR